MMATPKWPTMHLMYVHKKIEIKSQIFRIYWVNKLFLKIFALHITQS
jgi:hypothetical protein